MTTAPPPIELLNSVTIDGVEIGLVQNRYGDFVTASADLDPKGDPVSLCVIVGLTKPLPSTLPLEGDDWLDEGERRRTLIDAAKQRYRR